MKTSSSPAGKLANFTRRRLRASRLPGFFRVGLTARRLSAFLLLRLLSLSPAAEFIDLNSFAAPHWNIEVQYRLPRSSIIPAMLAGPGDATWRNFGTVELRDIAIAAVKQADIDVSNLQLAGFVCEQLAIAPDANLWYYRVSLRPGSALSVGVGDALPLPVVILVDGSVAPHTIRKLTAKE